MRSKIAYIGSSLEKEKKIFGIQGLWNLVQASVEFSVYNS